MTCKLNLASPHSSINLFRHFYDSRPCKQPNEPTKELGHNKRKLATYQLEMGLNLCMHVTTTVCECMHTLSPSVWLTRVCVCRYDDMSCIKFSCQRKRDKITHLCCCSTSCLLAIQQILQLPVWFPPNAFFSLENCSLISVQCSKLCVLATKLDN